MKHRVNFDRTLIEVESVPSHKLKLRQAEDKGAITHDGIKDKVGNGTPLWGHVATKHSNRGGGAMNDPLTAAYPRLPYPLQPGHCVSSGRKFSLGEKKKNSPARLRIPSEPYRVFAAERFRSPDQDANSHTCVHGTNDTLGELLTRTRDNLNWRQQRAPNDLGRTNVACHHIDTGDARPIKQPPRQLPLASYEVVDGILKEMRDLDAIQPSVSPWSSPIVLVKKKDSSIRFCVDYRQLNNVTKKDSYPLSMVDDTMSSLAGSQWFSTLDMKSGYWQCEVAREDKEKTDFYVQGKGTWQIKFIHFGLCNGPATFERLMEKVLPLDICQVYLDDTVAHAYVNTEFRLVKLSLHEAEEYRGSRTLAGLQKRLNPSIAITTNALHSHIQFSSPARQSHPSLYRCSQSTDLHSSWSPSSPLVALLARRFSSSHTYRFKSGMDPRVQVPHRSYAHDVQCFRRNAVLCKLGLQHRVSLVRSGSFPAPRVSLRGKGDEPEHSFPYNIRNSIQLRSEHTSHGELIAAAPLCKSPQASLIIACLTPTHSFALASRRAREVIQTSNHEIKSESLCAQRIARLEYTTPSRIPNGSEATTFTEVPSSSEFFCKLCNCEKTHRSCTNSRMEQHRNERVGKREIPEKNPPTSGIVRHDSHLRKSETEPGSPWEASSLTAEPPRPRVLATTHKCHRLTHSLFCPARASGSEGQSSNMIAAASHKGCLEVSLSATRGAANLTGQASAYISESPRKPSEQRNCPARVPHAKIRECLAGDRTRFAMAGGEQANRSDTAVPAYIVATGLLTRAFSLSFWGNLSADLDSQLPADRDKPFETIGSKMCTNSYSKRTIGPRPHNLGNPRVLPTTPPQLASPPYWYSGRQPSGEINDHRERILQLRASAQRIVRLAGWTARLEARSHVEKESAPKEISKIYSNRIICWKTFPVHERKADNTAVINDFGNASMFSRRKMKMELDDQICREGSWLVGCPADCHLHVVCDLRDLRPALCSAFQSLAFASVLLLHVSVRHYLSSSVFWPACETDCLRAGLLWKLSTDVVCSVSITLLLTSRTGCVRDHLLRVGRVREYPSRVDPPGSCARARKTPTGKPLLGVETPPPPPSTTSAREGHREQAGRAKTELQWNGFDPEQADVVSGDPPPPPEHVTSLCAGGQAPEGSPLKIRVSADRVIGYETAGDEHSGTRKKSTENFLILCVSYVRMANVVLSTDVIARWVSIGRRTRRQLQGS
ncbi:hypothetical protein PR048_026207 [Dryococelus australis]|uniref:Reverse transcriptase domain-containing protein n=1 Tax=Dryococelus australis TaxID=614101 RepID=A0ABQ9GKN5_9NEOP|nr:hypothetical protein PR048_026207 [Dryococelus australis]